MKTVRLSAALALSLLLAAPALAQQAVQITIKGHKFSPAQPHAPANQAFTIVVKNLDSTAAEFESKSLRVEKVVAPGAQVSMQIRPLNPGHYAFFDDFHQDTTEGELIVE
ncbi:cupredoxin domain-containing protein [Rhodoblastus sp.]|jgi:heme/copper-type cytochrome/quinol oxidase subunit 2|uniref:cupredoxin domain-containing protein n=1 Tax=Rhodoblastus sp. TaxID=1962975 RepID=UPI0025FDF572|nr:cupredoxin domain-containing protein [Rhodoblastus sp.]